MFDKRSGQSAADAWKSPADVTHGHVRDADASIRLAMAKSEDSAHALSTSDVTHLLSAIDIVHARAEALTVDVLAEALDRGLHTVSGLSARDWVTKRCPWMGPHTVGDLVTVAQAQRDPVHAQVTQDVTRMRLSVRRAAAVIRSLDRIRPVLDEPEYDQAKSLLMDTARQSRFTDRDLRRASDFLLSKVLPERDHESRAQAAREMRGVHESSLGDGSLVRFIVTCDAEGAAIFRAVMTSPLAAPQRHDEGNATAGDPERQEHTRGDNDEDHTTGDTDERSATQRRYDALITVFRRGIAGGQHTPTTPKATVQITINWDVLAQQLGGTGLSSTGDVLSPETVRKIACDADLVPSVLGTHNEILNMGRTRRLVTPSQRRFLEHRDRHCTFPGCSTPAPWCDAHHVIHWSRGGPSDVENYALLCGRHHTLVHDRDHVADVIATGVRWHV